MPYVISTMTNGCTYNVFHEQNLAPNVPIDRFGVPLLPLPRVRKQIRIKGGAGLPSNTSGFGDQMVDLEGRPLWTTPAVITEISNEDAKELLENHVFKQHTEQGYVKILDKDIRGNLQAIKREVASMTPKDRFAQLTPADIKDGRTKVKVGQFDPTDTNA